MTFLQIWVMRPVRYLFAWCNPMARRTDRIESEIALTLLAAFALSFPVASWTAESVYHSISVHAQTKRATGQYTNAVLLENAPAGIGYVPFANARWTAQDGVTRTESIPVNTGARAGSIERIWIDKDGNRAPSPPNSATVVANAVGVGLAIIMGAAVILEMTRRVARSKLNRRRLADWDSEWNQIGPRWTLPNR